MRSDLARRFVAAVALALLVSFTACTRQVTPPVYQLQGGPDDPVEEGVPDAAFVPREDDYAEDHPDLPGVPLSFNTLVVVFEMGTTVGEANALLDAIGAEIVGGIPGVEGEAEGILYLRVPTADHQAMIDLLAQLRADPLVKYAVQDGLLTTTLVPQPNGGTPATWTWGATPGGGNWGMERIRVPQLWNLNAAVEKSGRTTPTGVLDVGFANAHEDLVYDQNLTVGTQADHGTHVAGTIGATFDNGVGVDGLNPFADLVVNAPAFSGSGTALNVRTSWGQQMSSGFFGLIDARDDVLVVNASLGYNWGPAGINQNTSAAVHDLVEDQGSIFALAELIYVLIGHDLPVFVVAAGNDSNDISDGMGGWVLMEARWASPFAYAGIELDMPNVIVVESVANNAGSAGGATRSSFSNLGGDVSAPGSDVVSTSWRSTSPTTFYENMSGTSMASPHVTGLISYLFTVDPTLLHSEIVDLLDANAVAVAGGASPRIDAFATVMDVDRVQGSDTVLRMLLDIDDGTPDGNQRILLPPTTPTSDFLGEDADGDGGIGDGSIDMADFRRWRDWLLQVENPVGLTLDGSAGHPKKDVNGDGSVGTPTQENLYPRGDFNGDGQLSRTATRYVPGRVAATVTDLAVLQTLFDDPNYVASRLPGLIDSADLEIWPVACLARPDVASVVSSIRVTGSRDPLESRTHTTAEGPRQIYTVPVDASGYTARIEAKDGSGATLFSTSQTFPMTLGSDAMWRPDCVTESSFAITSYAFDPPSPAQLPFGPEGAACPVESTVVVTGTYEKNVSDPVLIFARPYTQGSTTPNYAASGSSQHVDLTGEFEQYFCLRDDVAAERTVDQIRLFIERPGTGEILYEDFVDVDYRYVRPAVLSVTIDQGDALALVEGATSTLTVTVDAIGGAAETVTWSSSEEGVATVDASGLVSAVATGTTAITATSTFDTSVSDTLTLTVELLPSFAITSYAFDPPSPAQLPFGPEGAACPVESMVVITGTYEKNVADPILVFARPYTQGSTTPNYAASGSPQLVALTGSFEQWFCLRDDVAQEQTVDQIRLFIERPGTGEILYEDFVDVDYLYVRPARSVCIDFEDPPFTLGTQYGSPVKDSPGDVVFTDQGVAVSVQNFSSSSTLFNYAEVDTYGGLPGQSMWVSNINLKFDFTGLAFTVDKVTFDFADLGGTENIAVNGSGIVQGELASGTVGGVPLTIVRGTTVGDGTLDGTVRDLTIGGQEFFLDNVCAFEVP